MYNLCAVLLLCLVFCKGDFTIVPSYLITTQNFIARLKQKMFKIKIKQFIVTSVESNVTTSIKSNNLNYLDYRYLQKCES